MRNLSRRLQRPIPVRRLFFKISSWFLLTTWGALTAVLLISRFSGIQIVREPNMFATVAPILAAEAVRSYESGGGEAFRRFSQSSVNDKERELYLLDGFYNDVLERRISKDGLRAAHAAKEGQLVVLQGHIASYKYTSPSGRPYILLLYYKKRLGEAKAILFGQGARVFLGLLVIIPLLCLWLAYHIASPIHAIQEAARRVAHGDLSARAPQQVIKRHDELAALAIDFNSMVERIGILLASHKHLLAAVSHELRSPLTRLNVSMALLRKGGVGEGKEFLDRMDRDIGLMDTLMGQLLTLSRLEAGISGPHRERVDLSQLVEQVGADGDFEAAAYGKRVTVSVRDTVVLAAGDQYALRSACENITRNAIRFTRPDAPVEIALFIERTSDLRYAVISVCDRGPGVPEDLLEAIFKPFFRITTGTMDAGNNGLGLAIAMGAVQLHHGKLLASNRPGGGLQVLVRMPLEEVDRAATESSDRALQVATF